MIAERAAWHGFAMNTPWTQRKVSTTALFAVRQKARLDIIALAGAAPDV